MRSFVNSATPEHRRSTVKQTLSTSLACTAVFAVSAFGTVVTQASLAALTGVALTATTTSADAHARATRHRHCTRPKRLSCGGTSYTCYWHTSGRRR